MSLTEALLVSLVGAFLSLDTAAVGQFMFSRPVVAGPVVGALLGNVPAGVAMGSLVDLLWLHALPVGVAMPLDVCTMAVLGTAWCAAAGTQLSSQAVVLSLIAAIPFAALFRRTDVMLRHRLSKLNHRLDREVAAGEPLSINKWIAAGVLIVFTKAWVFYFLAVWVGSLVVSAVLQLLPEVVIEGMRQSLPLLVVLGLAMAMHAFYERK